MELTHQDLTQIVMEALEDSLGVSEEDTSSICESFANLDLGDDVGIEIDLDSPQFMRDYYRDGRVTLTFNVHGHQGKIELLVGSDCRNPRIANDFIFRYEEHGVLSNVWKNKLFAEQGSGLCLYTMFKIEDEESTSELREELKRRLALLADEQYTNELRPFIHYFES